MLQRDQQNNSMMVAVRAWYVSEPGRCLDVAPGLEPSLGGSDQGGRSTVPYRWRDTAQGAGGNCVVSTMMQPFKRLGRAAQHIHRCPKGNLGLSGAFHRVLRACSTPGGRSADSHTSVSARLSESSKLGIEVIREPFREHGAAVNESPKTAGEISPQVRTTTM